MSRNTPASSRLKISNPTLISSTAQGASSSSNRDQLPDFDLRGGASSLGISQVWNGNQVGPAPAASASPARSNGNGNGESSRLPPPVPSSPTRPARSRARGTPDDALHIRPARSQHGVPPISTRQLSVHSNGGAPDSPTTPMSPEVSKAAGGADPWAADRAQRTVARQQTNDTAQLASLRTPVSAGGAEGGSALRNAAAAFMAASKQSRRDEQHVGRRPPRPKRTQSSKDDWDDLVGTTGGRFAEIDGTCAHPRTEQADAQRSCARSDVTGRSSWTEM